MKRAVRACYLTVSLTIVILFTSTIVPIIVIPIIAASGTQNAGSVVIKEWEVPTPNSRPHDPAVAPDGSLWYTGQMANKLGRFDPKTEQFKEFPLKTADSGPHGLVADREGNIWFTAISKGYIGKLNPATGEITEYRMPDARARDPHTPVFDQHGTLWFTTEESNFVGKLDPRTGDIKLKPVATPHAVPYGIVVLSSGTPYFCEFGANKLAAIDPKTMQITEFELPQEARPRRLAVAQDDTIYYTDYGRGYLGHFDPASKKVEEWQSPGGAGSKPYGITITPDGTVWYSESGVAPNTLVRFNPGTKSSATSPVPSGGGVIRNMAATKDGRVYLACSGVNKVGIAHEQ
jgi:virginiamycin B lyase